MALWLLVCLLTLTSALTPYGRFMQSCQMKSILNDDMKPIQMTTCTHSKNMNANIPEVTERLQLIDYPKPAYDEAFVRKLKNLPNLKEIVLNGPRDMDSLPNGNGSFFLPNMQRVTVTQTSINCFPYSFLLNTSITRLILVNNLYIGNHAVPENAPMLASDVLQKFHLTSSHVDTVFRETFSELPNLVLLDLSNNLLENLPAGMLENNPRLKSLIISGNKFKHMDSSAVFTPSIQELSLNLNPWQCNCNLLPLMTRFRLQTNHETVECENREVWDEIYPELLKTCPTEVQIMAKTEDDLQLFEEGIRLAKSLSEQETVVGPYGNNDATMKSVKIALVMLSTLVAW